MFGHQMQLAAAHASGFGSSFGQGGRGGFTSSSGRKFGLGMGGGGFGNSGSMKTDPQSLYEEAHRNPEYMQNTSFLMRQNSLLSEMTQSKTQRDKRSWATPASSYGNQDTRAFSYSIYDKPMEKEKPKLQRQNTWAPASEEEETQKTRPPSFSSNPEKMRSQTISTSSLPSSRPKFTRSISINENLTQPANMDLAAPMLRRQQSLDAEKAAKRRSSVSSQKSKLSFKFGKRRKSLKSTSDVDSLYGGSSVGIPSTPRLRSNTNESRNSAMSAASSLCVTESIAGSVTSGTDQEEAKLILSLMNPEAPKSQEPEENNNLSSTTSNFTHPTDKAAKSPTLVTKRFHNSLLSENNPKPKSQEATEIPAGKPQQALRPSLAPSPIIPPKGQAPNKSADNTDSDASEIFYDCDQNSPACNSLRKNRFSKEQRVENNANTQTDGEDTPSSCDTPPKQSVGISKRGLYPDTRDLINYHREPEQAHPNGYEYDTETLKVKGNGLIPEVPTELKHQTENNTKRRPPLNKLSANSFSQRIDDTDSEVHEPVICPVQAHVITSDPELKEAQAEPCTAESSESGYATSHRHSNPRDYHFKVSEFVNSLPNKPVDIDDKHSDSEKGVLNGSVSDIDIDEDHDAPYTKVKNDLIDVACVSGSNSDNDSDGDVSVSKLEVMNLLESPTDVRARVSEEMNRKKANNEFNSDLPSPAYLYRKADNESETSHVKPIINEISTEKKEENTTVPVKKHVEVNCVVINKEDSSQEDKTETKVLKKPRGSSSTFHPSNMFERFAVSRQFSSIYQSSSTSCVDLILHFLNFLLFITSAGVLGLSIWLLLKDFDVNDVSIILGNDLLKIIVYVSIAGAGIAMLAAFCLCCGMREDKVGLGVYAITLIAVICAFATAAVLTTIFSDKLRGIEFKFHFKDRLETMYGTVTAKDCEQLTKAWDLMQRRFQCCGGDGNENSSDSWALYKKSEWFKNHPDKGLVFVPESCCRENSNTEICQGSDNSHFGPPRFGPMKNSFYMKNPHLNTEGCYSFFSSYLNTLTMYIAITVGSLAGLYGLTVMLTWVFCFKKRQDYKDFADDSDDYYGENDDVFSDYPNKAHSHPSNIEETSFYSRSNDRSYMNNTNHNDRSYSSKRNMYNNTHYDHRPKYRVINEPLNESDSEDDDSDNDEPDSVSRSSLRSQEEVIERRNMWLSSAATAGHLLSTAIEEEDSNFEDSENER